MSRGAAARKGLILIRGKHLFATLIAAAALAIAVTSAEAGAREEARFDVYLLGLRAGTLSYAMEQTAAQYAVSGQVRATGVIGAIRHFHMEVSARGRKSATGYRPKHYTERLEENDRRDARSITYDATGAPRLTTDDTPRDYWVPPAKQAGSLDPLTTAYELLRDRTGETPCVLDALYGDGARMGRVSSTPQSTGRTEVTCSGVYERRGGFSRKELKEGTQFPFTLTYRRAGTLWELTHMQIDSRHGRAQLVRR